MIDDSQLRYREEIFLLVRSLHGDSSRFVSAASIASVDIALRTTELRLPQSMTLWNCPFSKIGMKKLGSRFLPS